MARVYVYERPVASVLTDVTFYEKLHPVTGVVLVKQEPLDTDENSKDSNLPLADTSVNTTTPAETTVQDTQRVDNANNKENELVSSKNRANKDKSGTSVVNTKKRKRLTSENLKKPDAVPAPVSQQPKRACRISLERPELTFEELLVECGVCFLKFRTEKALKIHRDYYHEITDRICDRCQMSFRSVAALDAHKLIKNCAALPVKKWKGERYYCCFCNRRFSNKPNLQGHVFHIHNKFLPNVAGGRGEVSGTDKNNETNKIKETDKIKQIDKIKVSDEISEPPLTQSTNANEESPSVQQKEISPTGSPTKKMRQTTITEFLSGFTKKEHVSPKKVDLIKESPKKVRARQNGRVTEKFSACEETPKRVVPKQNGIITEKFDLLEVTPKRVKQDGAVAKFVSPPRNEKTSTTGKSSRSSSKSSKEKRPFVEIYMDSNEMVALLDKKVKVEVEDEYSNSTPQNGSYNLRRVTRNSLDCPSSDMNSPPVVTAHEKRKSRGQSTGTPKRKLKNLSKHQRLRVKFNCKECTVNLVRCDMVVKTEIVDYVPPTPVTVDEDIEEVWRKKVKLKKIHVPLVRLNDMIKVEVNDTFHNSEKPTARQANIKTNLRTIFRCKVCKKFFSSKKNLYEHLKATHVFYISSVCSAWYKTRARLLRHYLHQHCVLKRMECCVCFEKFTSPVLLKRHMGLHCIKVLQSKRDKLFNKEAAKCNMHSRTNSCEACGKQFWLGACLSEHQLVCHKMKAQLKKSRQQPQCPVETYPTTKTPEPPLAFATVTVKEQHPEELSMVKDNSQRTESPSGAQPKRLLRGVAFAKGYNIDDSGTDKEKFSCTTCGAHFQTFQNLCLHERTYSQASTHVCESCNTAFTTQKLLQNHITATHMLDTLRRYKYFCTFCTQGFLKKVNLQIHTGHFHGGQTPIIPKPWLDTTSAWEVNTVCSVCNLIFESSERFIEHNMYYYKGQVFTCTFCNQIFQGMYMLNHHNKFVHYTEDMTKLYTYTCNICNEGFTQESQHHAHKLHVHSAVPEPNAQLLQDHTYAITTGNGGSTNGPSMRYNCEVCYMNFMVEEDLRQHKMEYSNDGEYLCSYCARKCPTDAILNKHESLSHTYCNFTDCYKCRYCDEVLSTCTALKCHEIHFHQKISDSPINSNNQSIATQSATSPGNVGDVGTVGTAGTDGTDGTVETVGTVGTVGTAGTVGAAGTVGTAGTVEDVGTDNVFACTICGMKFAALEKLNQHILEYSNVGLYNCHICNRRFPELYRLEVHKLKHSNLNFILSKHHCPICREGFANPVNVRTHVKHFHRGAPTDHRIGKDGQTSQAVAHIVEEPKATPNSPSKQLTKCHECLVTYDSESALRRHQARFANEGQHACEHCGRRFQQVKLLRDHLKRHAAGIQRLKYACLECDDRFGNPLARYQHIVHLHGKSKWSGDVPIAIMARNGTEIVDERLEDEESDVSSHRTDTPTDQLIYAVAANNIVNELSDDQRRSPSTTDQQEDMNVVAVQQETHLDNLEKATIFYSCPLCDFKINMLETFVSHLKLEHGKMIEGTRVDTPQTSGERVITCLTCGVTFTTENELKIHLKNAHVRICPTNMEDTADSTETDADVVQIVWEKKPDAAKQFGDHDDSDVHVLCWSYCAPIINYDKTVAKPELGDLSADKATLRIKDFAKMV